MDIRTLWRKASRCHTLHCKFWHFEMAVFFLLLGLFTPNLVILQSLVCTLWLCGSIVANPIIYRLVPSPSRFEIRQRCSDFCSLQAAILPSAEFICLRVAYRKAFWEELSRLIWRGHSIRRPLLFSVHVIFFHSLPSRVGCSFQGKLFSILPRFC